MNPIYNKFINTNPKTHMHWPIHHQKHIMNPLDLQAPFMKHVTPLNITFQNNPLIYLIKR